MVGRTDVGRKDRCWQEGQVFAVRTGVCRKDRCLQERQGLTVQILVVRTHVGRKDTCWKEGHMLAGRTRIGRKDKGFQMQCKYCMPSSLRTASHHFTGRAFWASVLPL